jgi:feruloyl-CoA synthase
MTATTLSNPAPTGDRDPRYRAHSARAELRPDGTMILTSTLPPGPVARRTTDWLDHWAATTPAALFLAERSGEGWREVSYAEARDRVRQIASGLLDRGMGPEMPVLVISGNGVDHALLALACQYVGVPVVPVAEQYALIPAAHGVLETVTALIRPRMVFADDATRYGAALALPCLAGVDKLAARNLTPGVTDLATLRGEVGVDAANAAVGPDTVAKILLTSGSTSAPKGVLTTHRMMCTNQMQLQQVLPFLTQRPPRLVDWLPWNHVFGGSHNFNLVLANGGALYIDDGKPVPGLAARSLENNRLVQGTIAFNVPLGFAMLRDAMRSDTGLRNRYFGDLDMLFYAGASLPQDVWADLEEMCLAVRGSLPLFNSSWGLTETAPAAVLQYEPTPMSGIVGVPLPGLTVKLVPTDEGGRYEVRVKGDTITPGYLDAPARTAEAMDDEGCFITGDAMRFVDPGDLSKGMRFDGRISEDFKLTTGIWVRAANLRLDLLVALKGLAADVVVTGAGRDQIGLLIVPTPALREGAEEDGGALVSPLADRIAAALPTGGGSAQTVRRALILSEPPSVGEGEMTAKGNLNFRRLLARREGLVVRLYEDTDRAVMRV